MKENTEKNNDLAQKIIDGLKKSLEEVIQETLRKYKETSMNTAPEDKYVIFKTDASDDPEKNWTSTPTGKMPESVQKDIDRGNSVLDPYVRPEAMISPKALVDIFLNEHDGKISPFLQANILKGEMMNREPGIKVSEKDIPVFKTNDHKKEKNVETIKATLPGGEPVTVQVSQDVKDHLPEPVEDMLAKELKNSKELSDLDDEEINRMLTILREMKGTDQWDHPADKLKTGLANVMRGDVVTDESIEHKNAVPDPEREERINEQLWKEKKFREYTNNMFKIFQAKNQDYTAADSIGSAFDVTYDLFGPIAPAVRFMDKVLRYVSLTSGKEQKVADEKVEDTLTDLANYALLTKLKIEKDAKRKGN